MADSEAKPPLSVRPRDAASLLLVRERRGRHEVLMGLRPKRDRFMPDVWVFPGGRVDRADHRAEVAGDLPEAELRRIQPQGSRTVARALAIAAVRETWEETGLRIGRVRDDVLLPDLEGLEYLARAITPAGQPIRYHARFFMIDARRALGRLRSNGELLELRWLSFEEARAQVIIDVTRFVLEAAERSCQGAPERETPAIFYRQGIVQLRREPHAPSPSPSPSPKPKPKLRARDASRKSG